MKKLFVALLAIIMIQFSTQSYFAVENESEQVSEESIQTSQNVSAEENNPKKLVALGDSITRGYGLADNEKSYVDILTEEGGFESNNFAVDGRTSYVLLEDLKKPSDKEKAALEKADYIVISIGGNDMLYLVDTLVDGALPSESTENPQETVSKLIEIANKLTPENMESDIAYYKKNVEKIIKILREMNPNVEIVMQTVYDPFKPIFVVTSVIFGNMADDINNAHTRVDSCIDGYNSALFELSNQYKFKIADVGKDFKESDKKYLNMSLSNPDIHPNAAGHRRIAEIVEQTIDTDGTIFTKKAVESSDESAIETYAEKSTASEKFSTNSDETVENSEAAKPAENGEEDYTQRLVIFIGVMAVISFVITFARLKRKRK